MGIISTVLAAMGPGGGIILPSEKDPAMGALGAKNRVLAIVTAYTSDPGETDDTPFITASGTSTRPGILACPRKYQFGTLFEIEGLKYDCQDRMALKNDGKFDIWMGTKDEAYRFGIKNLEVKILDKNAQF